MINAIEANSNARANDEFQAARDSIYRLIEEQSKKGFFKTEAEVNDYHCDPLVKELMGQQFVVKAMLATMGSKHHIRISW